MVLLFKLVIGGSVSLVFFFSVISKKRERNVVINVLKRQVFCESNAKKVFEGMYRQTESNVRQVF